MPYQTSKAPAGCNGSALGKSSCLVADDDPVNIKSIADLQAAFVARRFGLTSHLARLICDLAFQGGRA